MLDKCNICGVELNTKPGTDDCGGTCIKCMAECGDPDCINSMKKIDPSIDWTKYRL